jgi:hypothetical protein
LLDIAIALYFGIRQWKEKAKLTKLFAEKQACHRRKNTVA